LELAATVRNATNRLPPFDPYTYGGTNYNPSFHQDGAVGRFMSLTAKYKF
jgi:iron complex outermembrane receptor protein